MDAYFNFSHSHFPLKLACLKGYLAASTYIHNIYIYTSLNYVITYVSNNHGSGTALFAQLEDFYCFFFQMPSKVHSITGLESP